MGFLRRLFGGAPEPTPAAALPSDRPRIDRRGPLPPGHRHVIQGPPLDVVGESFHRDAIEALVGRNAVGHTVIVDASLALDPQNPVDPNAVAVWVEGQVVGHLSRADAVKWRPVLLWYAERGITPAARGDIRGGWRKDDGTWADFGISLYIASPKTLAERQAAGKED